MTTELWYIDNEIPVVVETEGNSKVHKDTGTDHYVYSFDISVNITLFNAVLLANLV